jgi:ATP-dependent Lon protease
MVKIEKNTTRISFSPYVKFYTKEEKQYIKTLSKKQKEEIINTELQIIKEKDDSDIPIRFRIMKMNCDPYIKNIALTKLNEINDDNSSSEVSKTKKWISALCDIPIGKIHPLPVDANSKKEDIRQFIQNVNMDLDKKVFGHAEAKKQIIRLLCQWITNPNSNGMVIGIQGPMGCGKTTLVKNGICNAINLPFAFIPLGGACGSEFLDGHSFTYEGSTYGKIAQSLMKCKCMNPVIFFDELDKVSESYRGNEIINFLIHLTDNSQNDKVYDKYFSEIPLDLSKALIIFSYNNEENINNILKDRMFKIKTKGYNKKEKIKITHDYLMPEILNDFLMDHKDIQIEDDVINYIIDTIQEEEGVRNLKRALQEIISQINMMVLTEDFKLPYKVNIEDANKYINCIDRKNEKTKNYMMYI